ncbi:MAG: hypothetical protein Q8Q60_00820 [Candidatus Chromulinivorax sp.]|nr:hypothetical protein [Candidatus Chromulinivorax sp.]
MKNIQKLMLMAFVMVASSAILQASCTIQMKNSTGYTMLQSEGDVITQIANGATFNFTPDLYRKNYYVPHKLGKILLLVRASGGAPNYTIPSQSLGQMCPLSSVVFKIKLDENNNIKIAA